MSISSSLDQDKSHYSWFHIPIFSFFLLYFSLLKQLYSECDQDVVISLHPLTFVLAAVLARVQRKVCVSPAMVHVVFKKWWVFDTVLLVWSDQTTLQKKMCLSKNHYLSCAWVYSCPWNAIALLVTLGVRYWFQHIWVDWLVWSLSDGNLFLCFERGSIHLAERKTLYFHFNVFTSSLSFNHYTFYISLLHFIHSAYDFPPVLPSLKPCEARKEICPSHLGLFSSTWTLGVWSHDSLDWALAPVLIGLGLSTAGKSDQTFPGEVWRVQGEHGSECPDDSALPLVCFTSNTWAYMHITAK